MTDSSNVFVAYHIWGGVLVELEVCGNKGIAQKKVDGWRKDARADDTLEVLEKKVIK